MQGKGIIRIGRGTQILYLPQKWSGTCQWKSGEQVQVKAGRKTVTAFIRISKNRQLALSRDIYEELKLHPLPISWKTKGHSIQLGPFIGAYSLYTEKTDKPFADNTTLFIDMTHIARELYTPFYVITPGGFHADLETVTGWIYNNNDKLWIQKELPWPDFCIKKHISVPAVWRSKIQDDEVLIRVSGCQLLTGTIGSKWDVHVQLRKNQTIASSLPDTRRLLTCKDIESMLKRHSNLYVKPVNGTQGKGIYRFSKSNDRIKIEYQKKDQTKTKIIYLNNKTRTWIHQKFILPGKYLVQKAIPLLANDKGLPADFRWLVQKDGSGIWQITARVARVADAGSITTNVSNGGKVANAESFMEQCGFRKQRVRRCLRKLDVLAVRIAQELEKDHGNMGEIGIDFGIDKAGNPWIIEVNTRPGRKMLRILDSEIRELSLRRPLEYARYTIGFEKA